MTEPTGEGLPPLRGKAGWVVRYLPRPIAENPERILINVAIVLIGLAVMAGQRSPVLSSLWPWPLYEWALVMLAGGLSTLFGIFRNKHSLERLGLILEAVGCVFYSGLLLSVLGWGGLATSLIFFFLAVAKVIRLVVSSAVRTHNINLGDYAKEAPSPPPGGET